MAIRCWWWHTTSVPERSSWRHGMARTAHARGRIALLALVVSLVVALLATAPSGHHGAALAAPQAEAWVTLAPMPQQQQEAAVAVLDGRIYVMGGFSDDPQPFTLVQVYDPVTDEWRAGTPIPEPIHHAGAATVDGKIYLV